MKTLKVQHAPFPVNEIFINADCCCDYCDRKYPESMMVNKFGFDASICEDCYDHFN